MFSIDDLAWTYCFHRLMACADRPKVLLQNIHNHECTRLYGVLTQTTLWILTTVNTSNLIPKIFRTETSMETSQWENWIIEQHYFYVVFNIASFSHQLCMLLYIVYKKSGNKPFSTLLHILWSDPHMRNFKLLLQLCHKETSLLTVI
jgi:hypothetical protein